MANDEDFEGITIDADSHAHLLKGHARVVGGVHMRLARAAFDVIKGNGPPHLPREWKVGELAKAMEAEREPATRAKTDEHDRRFESQDERLDALASALAEYKAAHHDLDDLVANLARRLYSLENGERAAMERLKDLEGRSLDAKGVEALGARVLLLENDPARRDHRALLEQLVQGLARNTSDLRSLGALVHPVSYREKRRLERAEAKQAAADLPLPPAVEPLRPGTDPGPRRQPSHPVAHGQAQPGVRGASATVYLSTSQAIINRAKKAAKKRGKR